MKTHRHARPVAMPAGSRLTRQRRAIIAALRSTTSHPDALWVYEQVRDQLPRISLGTVYRNLEFLVNNGLAIQVPTKDSVARFDANTGMHGHIACIRCDRIDDVSLPAAVAELSQLGPAGYRDVVVKIEFDGVCPSCQESERRGPSSRGG